jgi:hypothetical protein
MFQILAPIRFFATGGYQRGAGQDYFIAIGQSTVSKCIKKFMQLVIEHLYKTWIAFPGTAATRATTERDFRVHHGFPHLLGCIDCTHIALFTPTEHEESYMNHKGFHSLNVQMVSSHIIIMYLLDSARFRKLTEN